MVSKFLFFLLLVNISLHAQIISTVAGNGTSGYLGDGGPALNAQLGDMYYTYPAFDHAGNMYIGQGGNNNTIRKIDAAGIITTIAGTNGVIGYSGDGGPAINALIYHPTAIAVDNANNIFFADRNGDIIRKIDPSGIITTVSGQFTTTCGVGDGGPLALAQFVAISALTIDQSDNLYIADFGCNTIRKVNSAGIITTIAGNGTRGFSGDGGPATSAQLAYPCKVAVDNAGNIYVPDAQNHRIRKINSSGIITTIAGNGISGYSGDGGSAILAQISFPGAVVMDNSGNLYIGDYNNVIRKINTSGIITTYAGNGISGYSGDGGPAILASLFFTEGRISIDFNDNIYFVNYYSAVIRKIANCITASISQQPINVTLCNTGNAVFSIAASNTTGYQWQLNSGTGWSNLNDNSLYSGCNTNTLSVTGAATTMNNYQYRCSVSNICGTIFSTVVLLIVNTPVTPSVPVTTSSTNICAGTSIFFSASPLNGGTTPVYQWKKNGVAVGTNINTYADNGLSNGDVISCILTSSSTCLASPTATSNSIVMSITANVTPAVTIIPSINNICFGTPVTFTSAVTNGGPAPNYTWFLNNVNLFLNSPTYTNNVFNNGDVIMCVIRSSLACVTSQVVPGYPFTMNVIPLVVPSITITASANAICKNTPVVFTALSVNGGSSPVYQWKKNELPVGSNGNNYTDNNLINGDVITCTLTSNNNCLTTSQVSSNAVSVSIRPVPLVKLDHASTLCDGNNRTLDAGNFSSFIWNTGSTNRTIIVSDTGIYSVTVTDNYGCSGTDVANITTLLPSPSRFLPADTSVCSYGNVTLKTSSGFSNYLWSTGAISSSIIITQPGQYWLKAIEKNGCNGLDTINVLPKECLKGFFIPSAFTPNNDGKNDLFKPMLFGNVKHYQFNVYNRWGELVFQSSDLLKGWNGNLNGLLQDGNVFVWTCRYQFEGEIQQYKKGTVVLIR